MARGANIGPAAVVESNRRRCYPAVMIKHTLAPNDLDEARKINTGLRAYGGTEDEFRSVVEVGLADIEAGRVLERDTALEAVWRVLNRPRP